jgi:hypothetical protein
MSPVREKEPVRAEKRSRFGVSITLLARDVPPSGNLNGQGARPYGKCFCGREKTIFGLCA